LGAILKLFFETTSALRVGFQDGQKANAKKRQKRSKKWSRFEAHFTVVP
jgi:hypothetical protein